MSLHDTINTTKNMNAVIDELSNVAQNDSNAITNPSGKPKRKASNDIDNSAKKKPTLMEIYNELKELHEFVVYVDRTISMSYTVHARNEEEALENYLEGDYEHLDECEEPNGCVDDNGPV